MQSNYERKMETLMRNQTGKADWLAINPNLNARKGEKKRLQCRLGNIILLTNPKTVCYSRYQSLNTPAKTNS